MAEPQRKLVDEGYATAVVRLDDQSVICDFNMPSSGKIPVPEDKVEALSETLLPDIIEFFLDPNNRALVKEWAREEKVKEMSEQGKRTVLYIGYKSDLMIKPIREKGEEEPIVQMVKRAYPTMMIDDIYVETAKSAKFDPIFDKLMKECALGNIGTIVMPSIRSFAATYNEFNERLQKVREFDPNVEIMFALEKASTTGINFALRVEWDYIVKEEYAYLKQIKSTFTRV